MVFQLKAPKTTSTATHPKDRYVFQFHYKRCNCCSRVVPDIRPDQLGECDLCKVERVLIERPPDGWFERVNVSVNPDVREIWRSAYQLQLEARTQLCEHEQKREIVQRYGLKAQKQRTAEVN